MSQVLAAAVGVRELKAQLSAYLRRVEAGARVTVTDRGRAIATISPAAPVVDTAWATHLAAEGGAAWSGGKPLGMRRRVRSKHAVSAAIIEDRR